MISNPLFIIYYSLIYIPFSLSADKTISLSASICSKVVENFINKINAPMYKGDYIGTYSLMLDDEILYSKDFYLEEDIPKKNFIEYFYYIFKNMFTPLEKI